MTIEAFVKIIFLLAESVYMPFICVPRHLVCVQLWQTKKFRSLFMDAFVVGGSKA